MNIPHQDPFIKSCHLLLIKNEAQLSSGCFWFSQAASSTPQQHDPAYCKGTLQQTPCSKLRRKGLRFQPFWGKERGNKSKGKARLSGESRGPGVAGSAGEKSTPLRQLEESRLLYETKRCLQLLRNPHHCLFQRP